jgi:hypothetical protein
MHHHGSQKNIKHKQMTSFITSVPDQFFHDNLWFFEAFEITRTASSLTLILFQTNRTSSPLSLKYMKNGD